MRIKNFFINRLRNSQSRQRQSPDVPILMYHSIAPDTKPQETCMDFAGMIVEESEFAQQMEFIATHYETITLSEYKELRQPNSRFPKNPCILTFDDGFADFLELAFPILQKFGLKAVLFVTGASLSDQFRSWIHDLYAILDQLENRDCHHTLMQLGSETLPVPESNRDLWKQTRNHFFNLSRNERKRQLEIFTQLLRAEDIQAKLLTPDQTKSLFLSGIEIGGHTLRHEVLNEFPNLELEAEILENRKLLSELTGNQYHSFCYPFGGAHTFDERTIDALKRNGFTTATTAIRGLNTRITPLHELRRIYVGPDMPLSQLEDAIQRAK